MNVKGKTKEWNIVVINNGDHSVIEIEYGYVSGKMTKGTKKITHGKNIGKRNQTTHFEQAVLEAQSKWKKKTEQEFSKNNSEYFILFITTVRFQCNPIFQINSLILKINNTFT